ncbi:MAG: tRNA (cytidine(34)-2'-O)-methyltransferase [Akkermansiaceae bacterium]|nr:tRNA (cytidine(34)-2'-O)-methyltransferase [Akkermansiaceae bacterium]
MFHIVLVEPEIPHNAGAAGRLALATDSTLHLVEPLGFSLEDKHVKRTGLDYWKDVKLQVWPKLEALREQADPEARFWFLSTKASASPWDVRFQPGDYLVFGRETAGLPAELVAAEGKQALRIPMAPGGTRSLNLSTAVAVILYEAVRQQQPDWS